MLHKNWITKTFTYGEGKEFTLETGKLAKQADGAVLLKQGNTMLLATVVSPKESRDGIDYLPLSVEYQEKYAATGRFPGGFNKREARLSNHEIIISRLVDRALRPLFPDDYRSEIQLVISLISADEDVMPDCLAGLAASAAICISDIPFDGPISEVRVAKINGKFVINPFIHELKDATLDILVAGNMKDLNMVEGEMKEQSEEEMIEALKLAHQAIKEQCQAQLDFVALAGNEKREYEHPVEDEDLFTEMEKLFVPKINDIFALFLPKKERSTQFKAIVNEYLDQVDKEDEEKISMVKRYWEKIFKEAIRKYMLKENIRVDGRKFDEIREIECEVDYLPSAHGSALFTRGETQSLTTVTLGNKLSEQLVDGALFQRYDKFMLHYNFPSFSTGEAKPNRGPGRREIGHGKLAQRALESFIPGEEVNPYTIRIVSDILESNGSSSMATVCAGSLSLMDAGIKIPKHISGIAMGLIIDKAGNYAVLSDILGDEDHLGDMDFKVCGTEEGITACQMDIKVDGLSYEILAKALNQAKAGRLHILNKMNECLATPREDYKPHTPRIVKFKVENEFVGAIIGPGGKIIQKIQKETGAEIVIESEEVNGFNLIEVSATNQESMAKAIEWINSITAKPEVGKTYNAKVKSIVDFGAFLEYMNGKEGLMHISEYGWDRMDTLSNVLKIGDTLEVKLIGLDPKTGKVKLSRKALLSRPDNMPPSKPFNRKNDF